MKTKYTIEDMDRIADEIRSRISVQPEIGLILGSGLGPLSESIEGPPLLSLTMILLVGLFLLWKVMPESW